uniref:Uncharacterized protein n=1 Tax=Setaria digitata TaxID=48799 RepID=A0A915PX84_9BILA
MNSDLEELISEEDKVLMEQLIILSRHLYVRDRVNRTMDSPVTPNTEICETLRNYQTERSETAQKRGPLIKHKHSTPRQPINNSN